MPSNPPDLEAAIEALPDAYVQCRDYGHSWRPFTAAWVPAERVYRTQLRCSRCKTVRARDIGQHGEQLRSQYIYAEGYTITGAGRLSGADRDVVRLASVLRVVARTGGERAS